jgi:hypothetical protein
MEIVAPPRRAGLAAINSTPAGQARLACYILKRIETNFIEASELAALLWHLNDRQDLRTSLHETYEAHGFHTVQASLVYAVASILARIFDPIDAAAGKHLNRASLPHLAHLLRIEAVRHEFIIAAWFWHHLFRAKNVDACALHMDRALGAYDAMATSELGTSALKGLRSFRDRWLAHSLFGVPRRGNLLFGHFKEYLAALGPIVRDLVFALRGRHLDDDWPNEPPRKARAFGDVLAMGMVAKRHFDQHGFDAAGALAEISKHAIGDRGDENE